MSAPSTPPAPVTRTGTRALRWLADDRVLQLTGLAMVVDTALVLARPGAMGAAEAGVGWVLALFSWLALGLRHRWPVAVSAATLAAAVAYYPVTSADGPTPMVAFIVSLYFVARSGQLAAALTLAVVTMLMLAYTELVIFGGHEGDSHVDPMSVALLSGWFLSVIAAGHTMLVRHAYQHEAEQRALAAERERDVRAQQSATEERLRIARELHDVLGHNISLINVQASAAVHRSARRPGETAELVAALESVRDTSKEALRELRATLGVLRQVDEAAPTAPAAGLDRVAELVDRACGAGLRASVVTRGTPKVLPPQISLAAYRIVQESLTNVTRHAHAERVLVHVEYGQRELRVRVEDDGQGAPGGAASGSGIRGMAERARALGGELTAGNVGEADGAGGERGEGGTGFRVAARLPLPAAPEDAP